jgi:hypothetical protein
VVDETLNIERETSNIEVFWALGMEDDLEPPAGGIFSSGYKKEIATQQ